MTHHVKRVIDFEEYRKKWFEAKKKRYNVIELKYHYGIYDYLKFCMVLDGDGDNLMFEEKIDATTKKNELNAEWEVKLTKIFEARKDNQDIWEPMFLIKGEKEL